MFDKENPDYRNLAYLLQDLSKEDCLQIQGVIAGIKLAHRCVASDTQSVNISRQYETAR